MKNKLNKISMYKKYRKLRRAQKNNYVLQQIIYSQPVLVDYNITNIMSKSN